jgi:sterol desaturase/sphingolipid hydroxylase (fatty acid hydroxylase superfamily)
MIDYAAVFVLACIFIPLERLRPLRPEQPVLRRNWVTDVIYVLINGFFIRAFFTLPAAAAIWAYYALVGPDPLPFVGELPLWLQVVAVIIIADIGYYIAHRALHSVPALWRLHVIHHSIEEMDWLASHRVHPLEMAFSNTLSLLPVLFLGFSLEAIVIHKFIYQAHTLLLHTNLKLNFGPLKWIFATPEHHHWHHANERDSRDHNFAAQLSVLDTIGKTMFMPQNREPVAYGVKERVPQRYHEQLLYPFVKLSESLKQRSQKRHAARQTTQPVNDARMPR